MKKAKTFVTSIRLRDKKNWEAFREFCKNNGMVASFVLDKLVELYLKNPGGLTINKKVSQSAKKEDDE